MSILVLAVVAGVALEVKERRKKRAHHPVNTQSFSESNGCDWIATLTSFRGFALPCLGYVLHI